MDIQVEEVSRKCWLNAIHLINLTTKLSKPSFPLRNPVLKINNHATSGWRTKDILGGPKSLETKKLGSSKGWEDQSAEKTNNWKDKKIFNKQMGHRKTQNTHFCRWLNLSKFTRFLGGPNRPTICVGRTKPDFEDRAQKCIFSKTPSLNCEKMNHNKVLGSILIWEKFGAPHPWKIFHDIKKGFFSDLSTGKKWPSHLWAIKNASITQNKSISVIF